MVARHASEPISGLARFKGLSYRWKWLAHNVAVWHLINRIAIKNIAAHDHLTGAAGNFL